MAVKNAFQMDVSNCVVEGHVNRLKAIKRQMYGRADYELLSKKVIYYIG
jgi:transposase